MKKIKKVLLTLAIIKFTVLNSQTPFNTQYIDIGGNFFYSQIWNASTEQKNRILLLHRYGLVECDSNLTPTKLVTSSSFGNYPNFVWGGAIIAKKGIYLINNPNNYQTNPYVIRWNNSMTNTTWIKGGGTSTGTLNLGQAAGPSTFDNNSILSDSTSTGISFITGSINQGGQVLTSIDSNGVITTQKKIQYTPGNLSFQGAMAKSKGAVYTLNAIYGGPVAQTVLLKTDHALNTKFAEKIDLSDSVTVLFKIKYTGDHKLLLAGYIIKKGNIKSNVVLKTDSLGNAIWCKNYNINNNTNEILSIEDIGTEYLVSSGMGTNGMGILMKLDNSGNFIANKVYRTGSGTVSSGAKADGCDILKKINGSKVLCAGEGYFGPTFFLTDAAFNFNICVNSGTLINVSNITPTIAALSNTLFVTANITPTSTPVTAGGANGVDPNYVFMACNLTAGLNNLNTPESDIIIYPNPTNGSLNVSGINDLNIEIYNVLGNLIYRDKIKDGRLEIDLSREVAGIYFIRTGTITKKIIKQ